MAIAPTQKAVDAIKHADAKRKNIPTAEYQPVLDDHQKNPKQVRYPRNTDLDPQLVWRGKDEQDWSDLVVHAPPLYIQEKVHPKARKPTSRARRPACSRLTATSATASSSSGCRTSR